MPHRKWPGAARPFSFEPICSADCRNGWLTRSSAAAGVRASWLRGGRWRNPRPPRAALDAALRVGRRDAESGGEHNAGDDGKCLVHARSMTSRVSGANAVYLQQFRLTAANSLRRLALRPELLDACRAILELGNLAEGIE